MTPEEQRIAIAEALGWKHEVRKRYAGRDNVAGWGLNAHLPDGHKERCFVTYPGAFPDYLNDLNAMRNAEDKLGFPAINRYCGALFEICGNDWTEAVHATAAQRAEAFCRVIGKWKETP